VLLRTIVGITSILYLTSTYCDFQFVHLGMRRRRTTPHTFHDRGWAPFISKWVVGWWHRSGDSSSFSNVNKIFPLQS
jgi:hypothetical protein